MSAHAARGEVQETEERAFALQTVEDVQEGLTVGLAFRYLTGLASFNLCEKVGIGGVRIEWEPELHTSHQLSKLVAFESVEIGVLYGEVILQYVFELRLGVVIFGPGQLPVAVVETHGEDPAYILNFPGSDCNLATAIQRSRYGM